MRLNYIRNEKKKGIFNLETRTNELALLYIISLVTIGPKCLDIHIVYFSLANFCCSIVSDVRPK